MNKVLAIAGSIAGAISAGVLMMGMSSVDSVAHFRGCTATANETVGSRDLGWQGDDAVEIKIPASVHFTVSPTWRAVATGPVDVLKHVRMRGGELEFDTSFEYCGSDLRIELQGPEVKSWDVHGSGDLTLEGLRQDVLNVYLAGSGSLRASGSVHDTYATIKGSGDANLDDLVQQRIELAIHGSGSASARGSAERSQIAIYGSGSARFGKLEVKSAEVRIHGSGDVFIAPSERVDAQIYGSGDVRLTTQPRQVQQEIHGSGEVVSARI